MMEILCKQNQISLNLLEHFVTDFNWEKKNIQLCCSSLNAFRMCVRALTPHTTSTQLRPSKNK